MDPVYHNYYAKNFTSSDPEWLPGTITQVRVAHSFIITLMDGRVVWRHIDIVHVLTAPQKGLMTMTSCKLRHSFQVMQHHQII